MGKLRHRGTKRFSQGHIGRGGAHSLILRIRGLLALGFYCNCSGVTIIIIIITVFLGTNICSRPGPATSKSRILFKFHNSTVLGIIPTAQPSTAFCSESDHFVQLQVALYC